MREERYWSVGFLWGIGASVLVGIGGVLAFLTMDVSSLVIVLLGLGLFPLKGIFNNPNVRGQK